MQWSGGSKSPPPSLAQPPPPTVLLNTIFITTAVVITFVNVFLSSSTSLYPKQRSVTLFLRRGPLATNGLNGLGLLLIHRSLLSLEPREQLTQQVRV